MIRTLSVLLILLLVSTGAGAERAATADAGSSPLSVADATVRVPIPGKDMTSAYFLLHNRGDEQRSLVAVHAEFAERAELHSHETVDGMMRMREVESVAVPAGESVRFASGGYHVMLFGLTRRPRTGDPLQLVLEFDDGSQLNVEASAVSVFDRPHH